MDSWGTLEVVWAQQGRVVHINEGWNEEYSKEIYKL